MVEVKRFDLGTGSLEVICICADMYEALKAEDEYRKSDKGTDVVTWCEERRF